MDSEERTYWRKHRKYSWIKPVSVATAASFIAILTILTISATTDLIDLPAYGWVVLPLGLIALSVLLGREYSLRIGQWIELKKQNEDILEKNMKLLEEITVMQKQFTSVTTGQNVTVQTGPVYVQGEQETETQISPVKSIPA